MTRDEIIELQQAHAVTNELVQKLCAELLSLDAIVDRMVVDIAQLVRENEDLAQAAMVLESIDIDEAPTELNTQVYGARV